MNGPISISCRQGLNSYDAGGSSRPICPNENVSQLPQETETQEIPHMLNNCNFQVRNDSSLKGVFTDFVTDECVSQ